MTTLFKAPNHHKTIEVTKIQRPRASVSRRKILLQQKNLLQYFILSTAYHPTKQEFINNIL
jgi:hypothetical protein